jgi:hypothetical protein
MSATVSVKVGPRVVASRIEPFGSGADDTIAVDLPVDTSSGITVRGVQTAVAATKLWCASISLVASTPVTLDLTALTGGKGDTAFSDVTLLDVVNTEAASSARVVQIGNEGSANEWYAPLGAAGSILEIPPATSRPLYRADTPGWTVSTRKLLKINPGSTPATIVVLIAGH